MFFRRKSKAQTEPSASPDPSESAQSNDRHHYRQAGLKKQSIEFLVCNRIGVVFQGEFIDASIKGTSANFTLANDPGLKVGEAVDIFIAEAKQESHVKTAAKVTYVGKGSDQHWKYAFEFTSIGDLYAQLDEFYSRIFNRRQNRRIEIPPEQAVRAKLLLAKESLTCRVHDISAGGLSTVLQDKKAQQLEATDQVQLQLLLPRSKKPICGPAFIRTRTQLTGRSLIGIEFDLASQGGFISHQQVLCKFIAERRAILERWEQSVRSA